MSFIVAMFGGLGSNPKIEIPIMATMWFVEMPAIGYYFFEQVGITDQLIALGCMYALATPVVLFSLAVCLDTVKS